jgi:putative membrane protein
VVLDLALLAVGTVAVLHTGFFVMESILWLSPAVMRIFGTTAEDAEATRILALNQGFYNLGAAGLLVAFYAMGNPIGVMGVLLFLACMGLVGAITANWRIILVQTLPAVLAFLSLYAL